MLLIFAVALSTYGVVAEDKQTVNGSCTRSEVFNITREYQDGEDLVSDHEVAREEIAKVLKNLNFTLYRKIKLEAVDFREANKTSKLKRLSLYNEAGTTKLRVEYIITKNQNSTKLNVVPSGTLEEKLKECRKVTGFISGNINSSNLVNFNSTTYQDNKGPGNSDVYPVVFQEEEREEDPGTQVEIENSAQPYMRKLSLQSPASFHHTTERPELERDNRNFSWFILKQIQQPESHSANNQTLSVNLTSTGLRGVQGFTEIYGSGYGKHEFTKSPHSKFTVKVHVNPVQGSRIDKAVLANRANSASNKITLKGKKGYSWKLFGSKRKPMKAAVASADAGGKFSRSMQEVAPNSSGTGILNGFDYSHLGNSSRTVMPAHSKTATLEYKYDTSNSATSSAGLRHVSLPSITSSVTPRLDVLVPTGSALGQAFEPPGRTRRRKFKSARKTPSRQIVTRPTNDILDVIASRLIGYGFKQPLKPSLSSENSKHITRTVQVLKPKLVNDGATLNTVTKRLYGYGVGQPLPPELNLLNIPDTLQNGSDRIRISKPTISGPRSISFNITLSQMGGNEASQTLSSLLRQLNITKNIHSGQAIPPRQNVAGRYGLRQVLLPGATSAPPAKGSDIITSNISGTDAYKPSSSSFTNTAYTLQSGYGSGQILIPKPTIANPTDGTFNMSTSSATGYGDSQSSSSSVILLNTTNTTQSGQVLVSKPVVVGAYGIRHILVPEPVIVERYGVEKTLIPKLGNARRESGNLNILTSGAGGSGSNKAWSLSSSNTANITRSGYGKSDQFLIPMSNRVDSANGTLTITSSKVGSHVPQSLISSIGARITPSTFHGEQIPITKSTIISGASSANNIVTANKPLAPNSLNVTDIVRGGHRIDPSLILKQNIIQGGKIPIRKPSNVAPTTETSNITNSKIGGCGVGQPALLSSSNSATTVATSGCRRQVIVIPIVQPVIPVATGPMSNSESITNTGRDYSNQPKLGLQSPFGKMGSAAFGCGNGQTASSKAEATETVAGIPYVTVLKKGGLSTSRLRPTPPVDTLRTYPHGYENKKPINPETRSAVNTRATPFITGSELAGYGSKQPWRLNSSASAKVILQEYDDVRPTNSVPVNIEGEGYRRNTKSSKNTRNGFREPLSLYSLLSSSTSSNSLKGYRDDQLTNRRLVPTSQTNNIPAEFFSRAERYGVEQSVPYSSPSTVKIRPSVSEIDQRIASGTVLARSSVGSPIIIVSGPRRFGIDPSSSPHSASTSDIIPNQYAGSRLTSLRLIDDEMDQNYRTIQGRLVQL